MPKPRPSSKSKISRGDNFRGSKSVSAGKRAVKVTTPTKRGSKKSSTTRTRKVTY